MIALLFNEKTGHKIIEMKGNQVEISKEISEAIKELCNRNDVVASAIALGLLDAKGDVFVKDCIRRREAAKKISNSVEDVDKDLQKLLEELRKALRSMADE